MVINALCMILAVVGVTHAIFTAYVSGLRNRPIESWVYSLEFLSLLLAEAGMVALTFRWNAWNTDAFLWWSILAAIIAIVAIFVLPIGARAAGEEEFQNEQKKRNDEQKNSTTS